MEEIGPAAEPWHSNLSACTPTVTASTFVRKLRGETQAVLVKCSDDKFYIVKMHDNPAGKHVLANEYIGSTMALASGMSVPNFEIVALSEDFINSNPGIWFDGPAGPYPPRPGFHFGSAFMNYELARHLGCELAVRDYIAPSRVRDIVNRHEFLAMLVLDVFANKTTPRKAIFVGDRLLRAYFVDQGYMLSGDDPGSAIPASRLLHPQRSLYAGLWDARLVARQIDQLGNLIRLFLSNPLKSIPYEWYPQHEAIDSLYLYRRQEEMPRLMQPYEELLES